MYLVIHSINICAAHAPPLNYLVSSSPSLLTMPSRASSYIILNLQYLTVFEGMSHWNAVQVMKYTICWHLYVGRNTKVLERVLITEKESMTIQ